MARKPGPVAEAPSAEQLIAYEPQLRLWTQFAAQSFSLFRGANLALNVEPFDTTEARDLAHRFRLEAALMTVTRLSALYDADPTSLSFQTVNRGLKSGKTCDDLVRIYANDAPSPPTTKLGQECLRFQKDFREAYSHIDWKAHGRLQSFRNGHIAHIPPEETSRRITYGELEAFANLAFRLQDAVTLMTSGLNTSTREDAYLSADEYRDVWVKAFATGSS